jgi:2-oxoisovalerate dehydrogenase E1 component
VVIVEPIALYNTKDLHQAGDGLWSHVYPEPGDGGGIPIGRVGVHGQGTDLAIVTYGNGCFLSRQAEKILREQHGLKLRIVDLRWLAPMPEEALLAATAPCQGVLIVDECRITGSQSEALMALFAERGSKRVARLAAADSFIATGPAYAATLPSRDGIVAAALELAGQQARRKMA